MRIDRQAQLDILNFLADVHPEPVRLLSDELKAKFSEPELIANCVYLEGHGLIKNGYALTKGNSPTWLCQYQFGITSKGLDFLMDDGGLSAILGVVTVKLDAASIKALVLSRIDQANDVSHEEQSRLKSLVLSAGDQTLRKLVDTFVDAGLKAAPSSGQLIGMLQGLLA